MPAHHRPGTVHQQPAEIAVTGLGDRAQAFLAAARARLTRYQAEPSRQVTARTSKTMAGSPGGSRICGRTPAPRPAANASSQPPCLGNHRREPGKHRLRQIETDERRGHRTISGMKGTYPSYGTESAWMRGTVHRIKSASNSNRAEGCADRRLHGQRRFRNRFAPPKNQGRWRQCGKAVAFPQDAHRRFQGAFGQNSDGQSGGDCSLHSGNALAGISNAV